MPFFYICCNYILRIYCKNSRLAAYVDFADRLLTKCTFGQKKKGHPSINFNTNYR